MNMKYLLDTNILIHILHGRRDVVQNIARTGWKNCCISDISLVELYYGAECSNDAERNLANTDDLVHSFDVSPFATCIREACRQKASLRRQGQMIEDFDLFIGCTAIANDCIMVTENVRHLQHLDGIKIENWVERIS